MKYGPRADAADVAVGISGNIQLARDGQILNVDDVALHPRTAIGFSADGRRMVLLTVDGRMVDSRGLTEKELARLMLDLGSDDVLNLDGGGSSTMLKRSPGEVTPEVVNKPSDGGERLTPNGLGLLPVKGSGKLKGFRIEATGTAAELADTDITRSSRVLTGLSRVLDRPRPRRDVRRRPPVRRTGRRAATPRSPARGSSPVARRVMSP